MNNPTPTPAQPLAYNVKPKEIAARYGITEQSVTGLAASGDLPGLLVGSSWRFNAAEVHAAIVKRTEDAWKRRKAKAAKPT